MTMIISGSDGITFPDASDQSSALQAAKAWVNFNGSGTVAIRSSFNVSSITDNGTGNYTLNFEAALPDNDYCPVFGCNQTTTGNSNNGAGIYETDDSGMSTTSLHMWTGSPANGSLVDRQVVTVAIFGN
jgi:hypothetical protein